MQAWIRLLGIQGRRPIPMDLVEFVEPHINAISHHFWKNAIQRDIIHQIRFIHAHEVMSLIYAFNHKELYNPKNIDWDHVDDSLFDRFDWLMMGDEPLSTLCHPADEILAKPS